MLNALCLTILVVFSATIAFGAVRAWRSKRRMIRWGGANLAGFAAAAFALPATLMVAGLYKSQARHAPAPDIRVATTPGRVHRGQAIASAFCGACHSSEGTLSGGRDLGAHFPMPIGRFIAANLTPAGQLTRWSDGEIFRAIRWWSSKGTLALDAYLEDMRAKVVVPNTGDGAEDLRRHARAVTGFYAGEEGRIFAQFMAEAQSDPRLTEALRERFLAHRRAAVKTIWQRGVARGDFRDDVDADVAMDMIFAPIVYRLLAGHPLLVKSLADGLVDAALLGLAARSGWCSPGATSCQRASGE